MKALWPKCLHLNLVRYARGPSALGLLAVAACGGAPKQPDVILIVVDTLRADFMSLHGYGRETTPELEQLAATGTVFDAAYAGSSWTLPSMAMLFSGAYDGRNSGELDQPWPTLVESFAGAGYQTHAVVANPILGGEREGGNFAPGFDRGFESFDVVSRRFGVPRGVKRQTNGWYASEVVRRAKLALGTDSDEPQFLWLQLFDPHFPRHPSDPTLFAGSADPGPLPELELSEEERAYITQERRLYAAEVAGVDAALGELFAWLRQDGRLADTLIVVTADHGEGLWQRRLPEGEKPKKKNAAPRLYSDHGIMLTEEQIRVPLVFAGPGVPAGARIDEAVSLVDVAPTLRALCDLPVSGAAPATGGRDLFAPGSEPQPVYSFCSRAASLLVESRWRLTVPSEARVRDFGDKPQLYDLAADPLEREPLESPSAPPDTAYMTAALAAMRGLAIPSGELDAETEAARRALLDDLGYVDQ